MRGMPVAVRLAVGLLKPRKNYVPGLDVAGHVRAVGKNVRDRFEYLKRSLFFFCRKTRKSFDWAKKQLGVNPDKHSVDQSYPCAS